MCIVNIFIFSYVCVRVLSKLLIKYKSCLRVAILALFFFLFASKNAVWILAEFSLIDDNDGSLEIFYAISKFGVASIR